MPLADDPTSIPDDIYMKWRNERPNGRKRPTGIKKPKGIKERDRSSVALLGLYEYLCKEISCTPQLTLVKRIPIRKGSRKIYALMRIFLTRKKPSPPKNERQLYVTLKTPKPFQTEVRIIYPSSSTWEPCDSLTIFGIINLFALVTFNFSCIQVVCKPMHRPCVKGVGVYCPSHLNPFLDMSV